MLTYYETSRLILKTLHANDAGAVLQFYLDNKALFEACEPARPPDFYTLAFHQAALTVEYNAMVQGQAVRYWVFRKAEPQALIGTFSFNNIQRGFYSCCQLGYKFDARHHRQGFASESIKRGIDLMFLELKLHRIEAHTMPRNLPSKALLRSLGFLREGLFRENILINNQWEDHEIYSLLNRSGTI